MGKVFFPVLGESGTRPRAKYKGGRCCTLHGPRGCGQRGLDVRSRFSLVHDCNVMKHRIREFDGRRDNAEGVSKLCREDAGAWREGHLAG